MLFFFLLLLLLFFLLKSLCSDYSILTLDDTVYLKQTSCTYPLARSTIQRLTEYQSKPIANRIHLTFILMSMGGMNYIYHHTMLLWPRFVMEGMAGLIFCTHCALLNDELDELSHKVSENRHNLKLLKCIQMWGMK